MLGLTEDDLQPPDVEERGERKLVQALLGYVDADAVHAKSEEKEEDMEESEDIEESEDKEDSEDIEESEDKEESEDIEESENMEGSDDNEVKKSEESSDLEEELKAGDEEENASLLDHIHSMVWCIIKCTLVPTALAFQLFP